MAARKWHSSRKESRLPLCTFQKVQGLLSIAMRDTTVTNRSVDTDVTGPHPSISVELLVYQGTYTTAVLLSEFLFLQ